MKRLVKTFVALGLISSLNMASALPITGEIILTGAATVDFSLNTVDIIGDAATVSFAEGDFAGITTASYSDFSYDNPFVPIDPLWTAGNFTFTLTKLFGSPEEDAEPRSVDGDGYSLVMFGAGYITDLSGTLDTTYGEWSFSADSSTGTRFGFSSTTIPEPGVALLLAVGLAGVGIAKRSRDNRNKA